MKQAIKQLINDSKTLTPLEIMQAVNTFVNKHIKYVPDQVLYKAKDYWASPQETIKHRAGDCEDIAILKYWILVRLGLQPVFYYCHIRQTGQKHIVAACRGYVLDAFNVNPMVIEKSLRDDLTFGFAFNSKRLWAKGKAYAMADINMSMFKSMLNRTSKNA